MILRSARPLLVLLPGLAGTLALAADFQPLGMLPGNTDSSALGISADGRVVIGRSFLPDPFDPSRSALAQQAFRWTAAGGMEGLGFLAGGSDANSDAYDLSGDGSIVVGLSSSAAFRWSVSSGMVGLPMSEGNVLFAFAVSISDDGSRIAGTQFILDPGPRITATLWESAGGVLELDLEPVSGEAGGSQAWGISGDGQVVVGIANPAGADSQAFRWTQEEGSSGLGTLPGASDSWARGASGDGSVIVGDSGDVAFRWTMAGGMTALGLLPAPANERSVAFDVSADGEVVVGCGAATLEAFCDQAFVWTEQDGMRPLAEVLADNGVDVPAGWTLVAAFAISASGEWVAGEALNPDGFREAFIARISTPTAAQPLPGGVTGGGGGAVEPAALALWLLALAIRSRRWCAHRQSRARHKPAIPQ